MRQSKGDPEKTFRQEVVGKIRGKTPEELAEEAKAYLENLKYPNPGKIKLTPEEKKSRLEREKRLRLLKEKK